MKITTFNNLDEITGNEGKILLYDEAKSKIGASTETVNEIIQDQVGGDISRLEGRVDTVESNLSTTTTELNNTIDSLSGTVKDTFATKDELGKVGNFIVTSGDPETFEPVLDPTSAETKSIYLVQNEDVSGKDQYYEWIVTENDDTVEWTCIGETTVDLKDYAKTTDVETELALKEDKVFVAEYNVTPYADIKAAYDAGKQIVCKYSPLPQWPDQVIIAYLMQYVPMGNAFVFASNNTNRQVLNIECTQNSWSVTTNLFYNTTATSGADEISAALALKQDTLTAGTDLVISGGVIGVNTNGTTQGTYAFVEGNNTSAIGNGSHAEGIGTIASASGMHAGGTYNATTSALFVIGNGTNDNARSDAFVITSAGNVYAAGDVYANGIKLAASMSAGHNIEIIPQYTDIQNIHWNTKQGNPTDPTIIDEDINLPFNWKAAVRDAVGTPFDNTIKITFGKAISEYTSIILSIDSGTPVAQTTVELIGKSVGDEIANWYNYTPITIKEIGTDYIIIGQDNSGPTGFIYSITTTPEEIDYYTIKTVDTNCISNVTGKAFSVGNGTSALGTAAFAEGFYTVASSDFSHAEGLNASAVGDCSHAEGDITRAVGNYSHAEGGESRAIGNYSHAEGASTRAVGNYSHAEGADTSAAGEASHAEGQNTFARNNVTHAEGYNTTAFDNYGHAEGYETSACYMAHSEGHQTSAVGAGSHAEGDRTIASGNYSHAAGLCTVADIDNMTVIGKYNSTKSAAFVIGNGSSELNLSDAFIVDWDGVASATKLATSGINDVETGIKSKLDTSAIQFVSTSAEAVAGTQGVIYIVTGTNA